MSPTWSSECSFRSRSYSFERFSDCIFIVIRSFCALERARKHWVKFKIFYFETISNLQKIFKTNKGLLRSLYTNSPTVNDTALLLLYSLHTHTIIFLHHLRINYRHHDPLLLTASLVYFLRTKVFSNNSHSIVTKFNLNTFSNLPSIFQSWQLSQLCSFSFYFFHLSRIQSYIKALQ